MIDVLWSIFQFLGLLLGDIVFAVALLALIVVLVHEVMAIFAAIRNTDDSTNKE